jgi:O-antigen/teichoic acid export membrane protein
LLAPFMCDILHDHEATPLLRVLAHSPVITALNAGGTVLLNRELKFNRVFLLETTEVVSYSISVLVLGVILQSAWALVLGLLTGFVCRAIATYFISGERVGFGFDRAKYSEMYRYAKWIRVQSVVTFLLTTADNLVVARVVGTTSVGLYRMAFQVATQGSSTLIVILANVAFPAFSRLRSEPEHLRETYRGVLGLVATLMVPVTIIFVILADLFVQVVLGPKWGLATQCVRIIGLAALVRSFLSTSSPFLQALGYTRADFLLRTWQAVPMLSLLYPLGFYYGITGVANAVLIGALVTVPVWAYVLTRRHYLSLRDLLEPLAVPFLAGAVTSVVLLSLPDPEPTLVNFVLYCAILAAVYGGILLLALRLTPNLGVATVIRAVRVSQKPRHA